MIWCSGMIWSEIIFMILCFWNKPLLLTKAAIIWSKIKEKLLNIITI